MEEAEAANRRREAAEERERDLLSSNAALLREVEERRALLASSPGEVALAEAELLRRHEDLTLEAVEHSLALERLEVRERQAAVAEDAVAAREAQVQVEVEERVAKARADLAEGHHLDLELLEAELEARTSTLKTELQSMEQRESAAWVVLASSDSAWILPVSRYPLSIRKPKIPPPSWRRLRMRQSDPRDYSTRAPRCYRPLSIGPTGPWAAFVIRTSQARVLPMPPAISSSSLELWNILKVCPRGAPTCRRKDP